MAVLHHLAAGDPAECRTIVARWAWLRALATAWLLTLILVLPGPARADSAPEIGRFLCDGEPLSATMVRGAVDAVGIPNSAGGTVPGSYVVLEWRQLRLQLPRSNDAGSPVFTDGKWLWSSGDREHPQLRLRRPGGDVQSFACEPSA